MSTKNIKNLPPELYRNIVQHTPYSLDVTQAMKNRFRAKGDMLRTSAYDLESKAARIQNPDKKKRLEAIAEKLRQSAMKDRIIQPTERPKDLQLFNMIHGRPLNQNVQFTKKDIQRQKNMLKKPYFNRTGAVARLGDYM